MKEGYAKGGSPRIINIGLKSFYKALKKQNAKVAQIEWRPKAKQSEEISELLSKFM